MAKCELLRVYNRSRGLKLKCAVLHSCDGSRCTHPDPGIQGVISYNDGNYYECEEDHYQEQELRSLEDFRKPLTSESE